MSRLEQVDPEIAKAIRAETERQSRNLELIASENFVSEAVLEAVGSASDLRNQLTQAQERLAGMDREEQRLRHLGDARIHRGREIAVGPDQ